MFIDQFFETQYIPRRLRGRSINSVRLYRLTINQFNKTVGCRTRLADLTNENLLRHLQVRSAVAPATRNKELAQLTALWRLAVQLEMHTGWPDIQPEPEPERIPRAWLVEDVAKLLSAATNTEGQIGAVPAWIYWTSVIYTALDTGERVGALLACEWGWLEGNELFIRSHARKGNKSDRAYRLSPETVQMLAQLRMHSTSRVIFDWPYCKTYFWRKYGKLVESAGLPSGRDSKMHRLRKTTASVANAAGLNAQDALDHSDRRTTQRYLDPRFSRSTQPADILQAWLRGEKPQPANHQDFDHRKQA